MAGSRSVGAGKEMRFKLCWAVPVSDVPTDETELASSLMTINLGTLTLDWQLFLTRHQDKMSLDLRNCTRGMPHLSVPWNAFLIRKDGGKSELDEVVLRDVVNLAIGPTSLLSSLNPRALLLRRYIHPGKEIHILVILRIDVSHFTASAILGDMVEKERMKAEYREGELGERLWYQVSESDEPTEADLVFICQGKEEVFAHRSVLAAFSPRFRDALGESGEKRRLAIHCSSLSAVCLRQVLYVVYMRRVSEELYKTDLSGVLEATWMMAPESRLLFLETEGLLCRILEPTNAHRLWNLALIYHLPILANAIAALGATEPHLRGQLARHHRHLSNTHHQDILTLSPNFLSNTHALQALPSS